ncbi:transcriptional repressor LexA [Vermiculatibacterium agrestimuris]|jgi:repressor LexA|uniref:transcriptional repressor LexA n=1 Tax=Vermiculatibacterium agrestimuris TaxID=2941519 RepID=UPI00203DD8B1|nr:transcriptional repressor LexA [Vermiculatibacterium agrestimuris]
MPAPLTPKQAEIYDFILQYTKEHGYPPSVREIGAAVQLKSPSTVHFHMKKLEAEGYIHKADGKTRAISLPHQAVAEELDGQRDQVPLVGSVAAGSPILAEENVEEYLTFDTGGRTGEHFALRVRGESMLYAGILPDDLVIVHRQENFRNGDIVVALFEDEATVKTYRMERGHLWLMPENPEYEPIDGEGCALLGRVVAVLRRY